MLILCFFNFLKWRKQSSLLCPVFSSFLGMYYSCITLEAFLYTLPCLVIYRLLHGWRFYTTMGILCCYTSVLIIPFVHMFCLVSGIIYFYVVVNPFDKRTSFSICTSYISIIVLLARNARGRLCKKSIIYYRKVCELKDKFFNTFKINGIK